VDRLKCFRRRQFAFGPKFFGFEGWKRFFVSKDYCLTVHPDLSVHQVRRPGKSITLLGYLIDPYHPEREEAEILSTMVLLISNLDDVMKTLERMNGRFVIIVELENQEWLFHDAAGLRQVVYCKDEHGRVWCASQAETLAEQLGFSLDREVLEYRHARAFNEHTSEFWLVNNRTPYKNVFQLLPNHYLDLRKGNVSRFWPVRDSIAPVSLDEAVHLSIPLLKNSIKGADRKFDLKMGITAGIDSRLTLAATKELKDRILYFTIAHDLSGGDYVDVNVPKKLLPKLEITHHVLKRRSMSEDFRRCYEASATFARENTGKVAYSLFCQFGNDFTVLNSNLSEISQCKFWLPKSDINGEGLAIISDRYHPLAISEFENWAQGARYACENAEFNILGLFYWEQKMGRWASASFAEYDIVHETFTPYNNRLLNSILLGVSERYRRDRMWRVPIRQIQCMWPEVLIEPLQPGYTGAEKIRRFLRRQILHNYVTPWLPIYEYCRYRRYRKRAKLGSD